MASLLRIMASLQMIANDDGQFVARRYVRICTTRFCYDAIPHIRRQTFNIGINYVIIGDIIWQ